MIKNLVGKLLKQWLGVWYSFMHALQFRRLYHGMGRVCCQHVTTSPLEYQKSLQCWKTITILSNAIYPFCVESIEFLIKIIYVKKPLYHINGLLVISYDGHNVKWQPYCKHLNILTVYYTKFTFLKFSTYHSFPKSFFDCLLPRWHVEANNSSSV